MKNRNPKVFWNYVNSKLKRKTGLGVLKSKDGKRITGDLEKAEILNQYFASVFVEERLNTELPGFNLRNDSNYFDPPQIPGTRQRSRRNRNY